MSMRLRRLATVLEWLAGLSMLALPIFLLSALFAHEALGLQITPFSDVLGSAWTWNVWLGVVVLLAPSVLVLLALDAMRRLFRLYRVGDPLAPTPVQDVGTTAFFERHRVDDGLGSRQLALVDLHAL